MEQREKLALVFPFLPGFVSSSNVYCGRQCGFKCQHHGSGAQGWQSLEDRQTDEGGLTSKLWGLSQSVSCSGCQLHWEGS